MNEVGIQEILALAALCVFATTFIIVIRKTHN